MGKNILRSFKIQYSTLIYPKTCYIEPYYRGSGVVPCSTLAGRTIIRPVTGQGSSPETRFTFLKHFRILYPFIPNTIQINQRLCNN